MISQPNPGNGFEHHAIIDTLVDLRTGALDITVGSWPEENSSNKPSITTVLAVKYPTWLPEYHAQAEQTVNEHPQWTGLPPHRPNAHCYFDMHTKQWEDPRTLSDLKSAQWGLIKQARSQAEYAGFTWDGSTFDSDTLSQNRITGAVTLAQLSPGFTIHWTLADNSTRTLNQADMIAVGVALGQHVQTQFTKAQALRLQIETASTPEQVAAVVW
jgi:hypothetical protein